MKRTIQLLVIILASWLALSLRPSVKASGIATSAYDAEIAIDWFDLQLELAQRTPGFTPPVVSRAFAYSGVALYEAVVPGMPGYQSLSGYLNELVVPPPSDQEYDWSIVANSTLYEMTHYLYFNAAAEDQSRMEALYDEWDRRLATNIDPDIRTRSRQRGHAIADVILYWSLSDGGHEGQVRNFPDSYAPPQGEGLWVPTPRPNGDPLPALQPYWGNNRTFVLNMDEQCILPPPPTYSQEANSEFYAEAHEVYETVKNLSAEQNEIALFWADDPGQTATPPGHSISILNQVLQQEGATLAVAAEAYAKMGIAQADAFIVGWRYKYQYNLVRPITYIRNVIDPDWNTPVISDPVVTPPFPEYPSGHSVQSGAAAAVLTDLFGENYAFTDHTHDERGLEPRSFPSFYAFAEEAAISRLYGGIHYWAAIEQGVENGWCIGDTIINLPFTVAG